MEEKKAKTKNNKPNVLRVSLRLLLMVVFCVGAFFIYRAGAGELSALHYVGVGALLLGAAVILVQLIVWGLKWVKQERVSELGLHIVRYAVILASISLCVFVLLSFDFSGLYKTTTQNELKQQVLAGRMYVQSALGSELGETEDYYASLAESMNGFLVETDEENAHFACLYLKTEKAPENSVMTAYDGGYVFCTASADSEGLADTELLDAVLQRTEVVISEVRKTGTTSVLAAYSPVFTAKGEPVGVLEIYKETDGGLNIFHFATLELCLKLLALIVFFSFSFYGCMQLVDLVLRPRKFDKSRRVLSCGRESARPVMFFVALSAALPLMMLLFANNLRSLMDVYNLPWNLGIYVPIVVYIVGICIGQLFGSIDRPTLSEIPADAGLVFSFLCNLALCLFMDWKKLSGLGLGTNVILMLILIFVSGLGYGIAYRVTSKFQAQSDALFGHDKYAYLCTCLGAVSGIVLGGLLIENYSNIALRVVSCILTAFTAVISIILLEDLKATVDTDENYRNEIRSYVGLVFGVIPVGLACCYNWIYLTGYMFDKNISVAAVAFCAVAPIIAFCFGNRLRVKSRAAKKTALIISAAISALSFVPMILKPSFNAAAISCGIVCVAVLFGASAVYSMARHGELKKLTARLMPLTFVGILLAAFAYNFNDELISLGAAVVACVACAVIFLLSKFPPKSVKPITFRPGITDGRAPSEPPPAEPLNKAEEREKLKKQRKEEKARIKAEKEAEKENKKKQKEEKKQEKKKEEPSEKTDETDAQPIPIIIADDGKQSENEEKPTEDDKKEVKEEKTEEKENKAVPSEPVIEIPSESAENAEPEQSNDNQPAPEPTFVPDAPKADTPEASEEDFLPEDIQKRREEAARLAREKWQKREASAEPDDDGGFIPIVQ